MESMRGGPYQVVTLFDGSGFDGWRSRDGGEVGWSIDKGAMTVVPGAGSVVTEETFTDCFLHVEFRCPDMPEAEGQHKGNSGVYLQGRYEVQVLDSYGWEVPGLGDCGAIYNQHSPLVNACLPPEQWQSYDIVFRAPRFDEDGNQISDARLTVFLNGVLIHNNVELNGPTGGHLDEDVAEPGPLMLQDHRDVVSYRNIWLVHVPEEASAQYEPS